MNLNVPVVLRNSRRLQGDILCDASGRLYERVGQHVHPVHHLVAGPRGEVIDLAPPSTRAYPRQPPVIDADEPVVIDREVELAAPAQPAPSWREIAGASAKPRIVRFGEFKGVLGPQLLHPERIRDTHRMSCRVHLYEVTRAQRIETLTSDVFDGASGTLLPLTEALAVRLELTELVPRRRATAPPLREPGLVFPGERVVRLGVIDDPTAALPAPVPEAPRPAPSAQPIASPSAAVPPDAPAPPPIAAARRTIKTAIPDRFVGPWPFALTRDQAVYDLNLERARSWLTRFVDRLRSGATSGRERRKWQSLLYGKSLDDQLWAVPPPRGGVRDKTVLQWAGRTLEAAGYDARATLLEWEIFWRRKGL